ncbi:MAG: prolipoprotein diacylglyceryl transferase [Anaerolineales bacterium]|nr:prolipoprotein diacylglyceryl transferase [Anaerolineales bacterium]MCK4978386.1 prolipoprotein diacylglyceryl transferase [Anaerolineales bacterium]MCK5315472.1 prolipoprotein diacylglyceryl transferase [Anaerolineales bacterium]
MPVGFQVGPFFIRYYGIILMLAAVAAAVMAERQARRKGMDSELVWDGLIWVLIGGILGARLWHILTPAPSMVEQGITTLYYLTHPLDALAIWRGGLGIPGAVIGGGIALYLFTRKRGENFGEWADIVAPGLALAQAIGRLGNFVNQELYGRPTDLPWAIYIDPQNRLPEFRDQSHFHPLFLYEALWNLFNMALLLWLGRRYSDRLIPGDIFLVYLIIYPLGRFLLEFLRLDSSLVVGINANQTLMLVVGLAAAALLIWRHRRAKEY